LKKEVYNEEKHLRGKDVQNKMVARIEVT